MPAHRRNLGFVLKHWYRETGAELGHIRYAGKSKLGANAMALRALVASPDLERRYLLQAQRLARGIQSLADASGAFEPWFVKPKYPYDAQYLLTFYSGEAILALAEYALATGDLDAMRTAVRSQRFYLARYVDAIDRYYYPAYVPWHTQSLLLLHRETGEPTFARAVGLLNDTLLTFLDRTTYKGRFHDPAYPHYGPPHSAADAVYVESLAYAFELALEQADQMRVRRYGEAIILGLGHLVDLQYTTGMVPPSADPARVVGAFRASVEDPEIRVDSVQHAIEAFGQVRSVACRGRLHISAGK